MVLAWLGGVIAVLGIAFLFVLAAQRGWFTPPLRIVAGEVLSFAALGFALWFRHRDGRMVAVLAAAGTGIAGLYTTLFAASQVYGYVGEGAALVVVGLIAVIATVLAVWFAAESLAIFGVCAAILAPLVVAQGVTGAGVAFAAAIGVVGLACMYRPGWRRLSMGVLITAYPQALWLAGVIEPGLGWWMLGLAMLTALWFATTYLHALRLPTPRRLDELTIAFASATATVLVVGTLRSGDAMHGWLTLGAALLLMAGAFVPWVAGRSHPDLADLLGAYALSAGAIAVGILLHGSALTCGWAAEAAALALVADRLRTRGDVAPLKLLPISRADRIHAAATAYLALAVGSALIASPPADLAVADWGSLHGVVGLVGLTAGTAVWAFITTGVRSWPAWRSWASTVPVIVLAYMIPFVLSGEWVIVAWAAFAGVLAVAGFIPTARVRLGEVELLTYAAAAFALSAWVTMAQFATPAQAATPSGWGSHDGLTALVSVLAAAVAVSTACLRLSHPAGRVSVAAPVSVLTYALTFALSGEWVVVGWSLLAVVLALTPFIAIVRARLGEVEMLSYATGVVALAAAVTVAEFATLDLATTPSLWGSHVGLTALGGVLSASAAASIACLRLPYRSRGWSLAAPVAVLVYTLTFAVSGDAVLIAWTAVSATVAVGLYQPATRALLGETALRAQSWTVLGLAAAVAADQDDLLEQALTHPGAHTGVAVSVCLTGASLIIVFGTRDLQSRTTWFRTSIAFACVTLSTVCSDTWAYAAWGVLGFTLALAVDRWGAAVARIFDDIRTLESAAAIATIVATYAICAFETPARLFFANGSPARGILPLALCTATFWVTAHAMRTVGTRLEAYGLNARNLAALASILSLWTVTAAILGLAELRPGGGGSAEIDSQFQQGQVAVSATWCITGLILLYFGFRHDSRGFRFAGVSVLLVTPAKLFLYDLAFLPATARAISFIITGAVLIGAAFTMQRLGEGSAKRPLGEKPPTPPQARLT